MYICSMLDRDFCFILRYYIYLKPCTLYVTTKLSMRHDLPPTTNARFLELCRVLVAKKSGVEKESTSSLRIQFATPQHDARQDI